MALGSFGQAALNDTGTEVTGSKVAAVTFVFRVMKIAGTTLGETAGDLLSC